MTANPRTMPNITIIQGDSRHPTDRIPDKSIHCIVTSPPYWGLRDYGISDQIGLEPTPEAFVASMVEVFREAKRCLRDDGTVFLNLGDSYFSGARREDAYGTTDKAPADSPERDCLCGNLCGACREAYRIGKSHRRTQRAPTPTPSPSSTTPANTEAPSDLPPTSDSEPRAVRSAAATQDRKPSEGHAPEPPPASPESTHPEFSRQPQEENRQSDQPSECQLCGRSFERNAQEFAHTEPCRFCTDAHESESRSFHKDASDLASQSLTSASLKSKDLCGIPWRVAFALQADGWYLRQWMPWVKRNAMPESGTDRPATSCEIIFLLTKSERYFYDGEAVKMPSSPNSHARLAQNVEAQIGSERANGGRKTNGNMKAVGKITPAGSENKNNASFASALAEKVGDRNRRQTDWFLESNWQGMVTDDDGFPVAMLVNPQPFKGAHFATFPPKLVQPCILAGTSARGCCPTCGAPWERVVEEGEPDIEHQRACGGDTKGEYHGTATKDFAEHRAQDASATKARILAGMNKRSTTRWEPTCACFHLPGHAEPIPCRVLDPFLGSGTTAQVALELGRDGIGRELNPEYISIADNRTNVTPGLRI